MSFVLLYSPFFTLPIVIKIQYFMSFAIFEHFYARAGLNWNLYNISDGININERLFMKKALKKFSCLSRQRNRTTLWHMNNGRQLSMCLWHATVERLWNARFQGCWVVGMWWVLKGLWVFKRFVYIDWWSLSLAGATCHQL